MLIPVILILLTAGFAVGYVFGQAYGTAAYWRALAKARTAAEGMQDELQASSARLYGKTARERLGLVAEAAQS